MKIKRWFTISYPSGDGKILVEKRKKLQHAQSFANKIANDSVICHWELNGTRVLCLEIYQVRGTV